MAFLQVKILHPFIVKWKASYLSLFVLNFTCICFAFLLMFVCRLKSLHPIIFKRKVFVAVFVFVCVFCLCFFFVYLLFIIIISFIYFKHHFHACSFGVVTMATLALVIVSCCKN